MTFLPINIFFRLKSVSNSTTHWCALQFTTVSIFLLSVLQYLPSLNLSSFPFDHATKARRQISSWNRTVCQLFHKTSLTSLLIFSTQQPFIVCDIWAVGSLTPFNQINFIFLSMLSARGWVKIGRDLAWFKMLIFSNSFIFSFYKAYKLNSCTYLYLCKKSRSIEN